MNQVDALFTCRGEAREGWFGQLLGRAVNRAYQEISCAVQKQNVRQVSGRVARILENRSHVTRTAYAQGAFFQEIFSGGCGASFFDLGS